MYESWIKKILSCHFLDENTISFGSISSSERHKLIYFTLWIKIIYVLDGCRGNTTIMLYRNDTLSPKYYHVHRITSILSFCFQSNIDRNIIHNKNCKNGMKESTILSFTHIRKDKKYWHIGQIPFNYSWLKMKLVLYVIYSWLPKQYFHPKAKGPKLQRFAVIFSI